jgi:hypothetical protein
MRCLFLCRFSDAGTGTLVRPLRRCGLSGSMVVADRRVRNSSRWQAVRAPQLAKRRRIHHRPRRSTKSFLVREISDVSLATFYVLDKENAGPPPLFQKLRLAVGAGAGCGCSFGCAYWPQPPQRQRRRHSIERGSLRTARTKWRPAQPPQSSFARQAYSVPRVLTVKI